MQVELVLTIMAEDRPGLVEALAQVIADHSGNWVDSAMSRLSGEFAGLIAVEVDEPHAGQLESALKSLSSQGIDVHVRRGIGDSEVPGQMGRLELIGQDHRGIVLKVTRLLATKGVNVESMNTSVFTASMSGEQMFKAVASIRLPEGADLTPLGDALEEIAHDLMVEITLDDDG